MKQIFIYATIRYNIHIPILISRKTKHLLNQKGKYMNYENIVKNVTISIDAYGYKVLDSDGEVVQEELLCEMMVEYTNYTGAEKLKLILDDVAEHVTWIGNKMCWELF